MVTRLSFQFSIMRAFARTIEDVMNATGLRIHPATLDDLEIIAANNVALAREAEGRQLDPSTVRAGVQRLLTDPARGVYYLAERDGKTVGQLLITREWSDWRNGWFWWIQSVYVAPDARRQGVFRALHTYVAAEARRQPDVCGLRLYVDRHNTRAQRVYEGLGMRPSGYQIYEITSRTEG
jgi:GNAT superfamily N-acetyltransferase